LLIISEIIKEIPNSSFHTISGEGKNGFDSHEFIRKFAKKFELEYVEFLYNYRNKNPFRVVHAQIALNLLKNKKRLNIIDSGKTLSSDVFGIVVENEGWVKTV
jgi:hypothetical protein